MSAPVPQTFGMTTWPMATGAVSVTPSRAAITSNIWSLGMGRLVLTGQRGRLPPVHRTVEVTTRVGWIS